MSTVYNNQKILKKRIRDEKNNPVGMIVALNKNQLGWSLCNVEKGDIYNDNLAFLKAVKRAESGGESDYSFWSRYFRCIRSRRLNYGFGTGLNINVVDYELYLLQERANKYFKEKVK
jgi:hypothetical protein